MLFDLLRSRPIFAVLLILAFMLGGSLIAAIWALPRVQAYEEFTAQLNTLGDIQIGETRASVSEKRGTPSSVSNQGEKPQMVRTGFLSNEANLVDPDDVHSYSDWSYMTIGESFQQIHLSFADDKVQQITCLHSCSTVHGIEISASWDGDQIISTGTTEKAIISSLGEPESTGLREQGGRARRMLEYPSLGLSFVMEGELVAEIIRNGSSPGFWAWLNGNYPGGQS